MIPPTFNARRASRYRILRQLGHGNLTRVFLAATPRSTAGQELVVLKLLHAELARDDDFRALFLDQAATALSLRHPNLVRTLEVVAEPDACGSTMEFLRGQTLARVLERVGRMRFPVDLHLHLLSQVLAALEHAHECAGPRHASSGFFHRDVCPSNVFITHDGQVKLLGTGFGNALRTLESRLARPLLDVKYAAPEVLLGDPAGPSADLFAVGIMIWEAVTRQARISSDDQKTVVQRRTRGEELALVSAWPDAPEPLIALCQRALAVNPSERYQSALAFRTDLEAYLGRAAEKSNAVLARLPELMEASFGAEREQMQAFVNERLAALDEDAEAEAAPAEADDEPTPHDDPWTEETNPAGLPDDPEELEPGFRTGMRRARHEPLRREAGIRDREPFDAGPRSRPAAPERSARAARDLGQRRDDAVDAIDAVDAVEPTASLTSSSLPPPPHETTTAGHRAYSSNLDVSGRPRLRTFRLSPDMLGAVALLLGSLVAVYSIYRHSQRDRKAEPRQLAIEPAPRSLSLSSGAPVRAVMTAQPNAAPTADPSSASDAGVPEEPVPGPAFFDGNAAATPGVPPELRADELPMVDPALRSLQDAIVVAAKAHRFALERRRARRAEAAQRPSAAAPAASRPIEQADPDTDGSAP